MTSGRKFFNKERTGTAYKVRKPSTGAVRPRRQYKNAGGAKQFWINVFVFTIVLLGLYGIFRYFYNPNIDQQYGRMFEEQQVRARGSGTAKKQAPKSGTTEERTKKYQGTSENDIRKFKGERYASY